MKAVEEMYYPQAVQRSFNIEKALYHWIGSIGTAIAILISVAILHYKSNAVQPLNVNFGGIYTVLIAILSFEIFVYIRFSSAKSGQHRPQMRIWWFYRDPSRERLFPDLRNGKVTLYHEYPLWRLVVECSALGTICYVSGGGTSPYLSTFLYFSALAEFVLDRTFKKLLFLAYFLAVMGGVLFLGPQLPNIPRMTTFLLTVLSGVMTGSIIYLLDQWRKRMMDKVVSETEHQCDVVI